VSAGVVVKAFEAAFRSATFRAGSWGRRRAARPPCLGDQRIRWLAAIRRCSSHCTVPSVTAVGIGSPLRRAFA